MKLIQLLVICLIVLASGIGLGANIVKPTTSTTTNTTTVTATVTPTGTLTEFIFVSTVTDTKIQNQTTTVYQNVTTTAYNGWVCYSWIELNFNNKPNGTWIQEGFFFDENNITTVYPINATANFWILCNIYSIG